MTISTLFSIPPFSRNLISNDHDHSGGQARGKETEQFGWLKNKTAEAGDSCSQIVWLSKRVTADT